MIYVIADIHGEYEKLASLLAVLEKDAKEYVFLGDFVNKGDNAKEVISCLTDLAKVRKCTFLMGDHEYAWLQYFAGEERFLDFLIDYGGVATLKRYIGKELDDDQARSILLRKDEAKKILSEFLKFCTNLKFYYEINDNFLGIHAGINPENKDLSLDEHNKEELVFIRNKFIDSEFFYRGRRVIFGHTAFKEPYVDKYKIGIDAGAVYQEGGYGNLLAFNINKGEFVNYNGGIKKI